MSNVIPIKNVEVDREKAFQKWNRLKPIYFQTWVWEEVCKRFPDRYKMFLPTYQGQKVILT